LVPSATSCSVSHKAPYLACFFSCCIIAEVAEVLVAHSFKGHSYADDTQMYISVPAADAVDAALRLPDCIVSIESWMSSHRLKMNPRQDSATLDRNAAAAVTSKSSSTKSHYRQDHSFSHQSCRTSAYSLKSNSAWLITSRVYSSLATFSCGSSASSTAA